MTADPNAAGSSDEDPVDKTPDEVVAEREDFLAKARAKRDGKIAKSQAGIDGLTVKAAAQRDDVIAKANTQYSDFEEKVNNEAGADEAKVQAIAPLKAKACAMRDAKVQKANGMYDGMLAKASAKHESVCNKENSKYAAFEDQLLDDYEQKLLIAEKVARKLEKRARVQAKKDREEARLRAAMDKKAAKEAEVQENIERIKNLKPKKKKKAKKAVEVVKAKVPSKLLNMKSGKSAAKALKKYTGRYCFMCFFNADEAAYGKHFAKIAPNHMTNIVWMSCPISDQFQDSMLLYEFNATPAVVICYDGKPSKKHRYIIGDTEESRNQLAEWAASCDAEA